MKKIIYPNQGGGVSIVYPSANCGLSVEEIAEKDVPAGVPFALIEDEDIPQDRLFRKAWEFSQNGIFVNLNKAKEIWKDQWREVRAPKLQDLDIAFLRALENGDQSAQSRIASEKQELRDVTLVPISGTTIEEIKSVWPEILG